MDWIQVAVIIGTLGTMMYWFITRLEKDITNVDIDLKASNQRIDQLYRMFIEVQKENHKKFYDLLREQKIK
jgi:hypothetical protein